MPSRQISLLSDDLVDNVQLEEFGLDELDGIFGIFFILASPEPGLIVTTLILPSLLESECWAYRGRCGVLGGGVTKFMDTVLCACSG